jgi:hypothetical protein
MEFSVASKRIFFARSRRAHAIRRRSMFGISFGKIKRTSSEMTMFRRLGCCWVPTVVFLFACNPKPDPCGPNDPQNESDACVSARQTAVSSTCRTDGGSTPPICASQTTLPTWESSVKQLITTKCSTGGCHTNANSYAGFKSYYDSETNTTRFQSYLSPSHYDLPQAQYDMLKCWLALCLPQASANLPSGN